MSINLLSNTPSFNPEEIMVLILDTADTDINSIPISGAKLILTQIEGGSLVASVTVLKTESGSGAKMTASY